MNAARAVDLEAEYDNRARVPEHPAIIAGWERDAAAYREARRGHAEMGLRYGEHPRQTIELFHPDARNDRGPLVVFIHGGYWRSLHPALFSHFAAGANSHGYALALPGYRLCPEVTVADITADLRAACLFLARRFPGRSLVASGHSAGGHLAAAMAATDWRAVAPDLPPDLIRRAQAISGIFDLTPLIETSVNESLRLDPATARAVSPALWPPPAGVRLDLWVGETETSEYFRQAQLIAAKWGERGARASIAMVPGANHFTAPAGLADRDSLLTQALVALCRAAAALDYPGGFP